MQANEDGHLAALDELLCIAGMHGKLERVVVGEQRATTGLRRQAEIPGRLPAPSSRRVDLDLLTTAEVARLMRVDASTVRQWRHRNYGPRWTKVGRRCLYERSDVVRWFVDQRRLTQGSRGRLTLPSRRA